MCVHQNIQGDQEKGVKLHFMDSMDKIVPLKTTFRLEDVESELSYWGMTKFWSC